jgi:hypothetical protein
MACLGASHDYYHLIHIIGYLLDHGLMAKVIGLEAPNN